MKTTSHLPPSLDSKLTSQHAEQVENWLVSQPEITYASVENNGADIFAHCKNNRPLINDTLTHEKTKLWSRVFDIHYEKISGSTDQAFNTNVWKSSYNGQEIPEEDMKEWVNTTTTKILRSSSKKSNVLEIGCGNGLILTSIIEHVSSYVGIDSSAYALRSINELFKDRPELKKIKLFQAQASEVDTIPKEKFDLVIINSVAQYFPNIDYLISVLSKLEDYLDLNSTIFIGDVRSFSLSEVFLTDILSSRVNRETLKSELIPLLNRQKAKESETLYDPRLFKLLPKLFDWISSVKTELRRGHFENEMSKFRFDVEIKCKNEKLISPDTFLKLDWEKNNFNKEKLESLLKQDSTLPFIIFNIPNNRVSSAVKFNHLFKETKSEESINEIIILSKNESGINPEDLWELGEKYSWKTEVDWDLNAGLERMSLSCFKNPITHITLPNSKLLLSELSNRVATTTIPAAVQSDLNGRLKTHFNNEVPFKEIHFISQDLINLIS